MASDASTAAQLHEAGEQAMHGMDYKLHTPSRMCELLATRVAANPAVAALPRDSLVKAAVQLMECYAGKQVLQRQMDRQVRYGGGSARVPPTITATAQREGRKLLALSTEETVQAATQAALLLPPLGAAMSALQERAAAGPLAATRLELAFFTGERRLREHGTALRQQGRTAELTREMALDVALEMGAYALDLCHMASMFSGMVAVAADAVELSQTPSFAADEDNPWVEVFSFAADAVQLALQLAMQGGAQPLRGSWLHTSCLLEGWRLIQEKNAASTHSEAIRTSASFRAMRATFAEGGAAAAFLRATAATRPAMPQRRTTAEEPTLRCCDAPECTKAEHTAGDFKKCARCGAVRYCSKACQVLHWRAGHKRECCGAAAA
jgi:hypothetical protein